VVRKPVWAPDLILSCSGNMSKNRSDVKDKGKFNSPSWRHVLCLINHHATKKYWGIFLNFNICWDFKSFHRIQFSIKSHDSSVSIALGYGLDDRGSWVRFPAGAGNFFHHRVQNGSGAHPAYPMGTRGSCSGGKAAGAWSWQLISI
jgi:hypothetical protein